MVSTHILSAYDEDLKFLTRRIAEMGGPPSRWLATAYAR